MILVMLRTDEEVGDGVVICGVKDVVVGDEVGGDGVVGGKGTEWTRTEWRGTESSGTEWSRTEWSGTVVGDRVVGYSRGRHGARCHKIGCVGRHSGGGRMWPTLWGGTRGNRVEGKQKQMLRNRSGKEQKYHKRGEKKNMLQNTPEDKKMRGLCGPHEVLQ